MRQQKASPLAWTIAFCSLFTALALAGFAAWDQPALEAVKAGVGANLKGVARAFSRYGDFPWLLGGGLVALAFFLKTQRSEWARIVTAMLLAGVLAGLTSNVIKLGAGRVRPRVENVEPGWYGPLRNGEWASLRNDFQGFPSSHAACAFGFFLPLFLSRRLVGTAGLLAAAGIAWSRVQLNAHHISDVASGALLGVIAGWIVWRWILERGGLSRWLRDAES